ncbi:anaphase-promoting complex subunit 11 isoform X2 [Catharus ustulatus]|uniref:anaphase-promoting complex subunit 11 isoform X2 n=1 Tax=Catharus ustulatus TaxID=91951 RepID=UPI00140E34A0|nr:anaphase-promoting complex subunit 11 isoform X2 [Catharus ustulatus]
MRVRVRSWHGVASWLWVANDENCGICRMAFNGCCPDCECGTGTGTGQCALGGADGVSVPQVLCVTDVAVELPATAGARAALRCKADVTASLDPVECADA